MILRAFHALLKQNQGTVKAGILSVHALTSNPTVFPL
jgi:F0F1-type ATP synthase delta subunit